ncbi:heavy metal-associated domain-containing protein [Clostridium sp. AM58-1XD]|uniref:heavy-metal-associated domain-containing protein n=1 Tax=Clostridium sp. AM58-1XD TaxID=2292307 RepID=UPI000E538E3C|nr:heavy metal-associated domain-containing protein [Clostridium sp. AM58-1XD]RGY95696.1 heavy-metal-associated domain-containing protein [Clostridium sp. AM58-1XD]
MKKFRCEEMMCANCVARINKGLEAENIGHSVDLDTKTVTVNEDGEAAKAAEVLDDLGFTPAEI